MAVEVIGHRGARGLYPELSLPGFEKTLELGVRMIELDVAVTADGFVVAYHDYALNPDITRDASGRWLEQTGPCVCRLALAELQRFDIGRIRPGTDYAKLFSNQTPVDGARIPTLEEIARLAESFEFDVTLCIEAKHSAIKPNLTLELEPFTNAIVAEVHRLQIASNSIIQSFDWSVLNRIRVLDPEIELWHLTSRLPAFTTVSDVEVSAWTDGFRLSDYNHSIPEMIHAAGGSVWNADHESLCEESIQQSHDFGQKIYAWAANETEDFKRLIDAGIDGIATDYPDRLISFLRQYG